MHGALRFFSKVNHKDYYAADNIDLFPCISGITPYTALCLVF